MFVWAHILKDVSILANDKDLKNDKQKKSKNMMRAEN